MSDVEESVGALEGGRMEEIGMGVFWVEHADVMSRRQKRGRILRKKFFSRCTLGSL
jgi:hypothetical protein